MTFAEKTAPKFAFANFSPIRIHLIELGDKAYVIVLNKFFGAFLAPFGAPVCRLAEERRW